MIRKIFVIEEFNYYSNIQYIVLCLNYERFKFAVLVTPFLNLPSRYKKIYNYVDEQNNSYMVFSNKLGKTMSLCYFNFSKDHD